MHATDWSSLGSNRYQQIATSFMGSFRRTLLNHLAFASASFPKHLPFTPFSKVAFIRHGNTNKAPIGGTDFDRQLTELGRDQAKAAGLSYGVDLQPFYPVALCSPAPRCVETAKIFLNAAGVAEEQIEFVYNQDLYDGTMQPEGSRLFKKIGYAPLRNYYEDSDVDDRRVAHEVLGSYGESSLNAIKEVSRDDGVSNHSDNKSTLLFFAHAVYLPAASLCLASASGCLEEDLCLDTNTKEAEGFLVDLERRKCSLLCRS